MKNELTKVIEQEKIIPTQAEFLLENFKIIFETAKEFELKASKIKVTDISQVEEMKKANELRIEIKNLRCEANNKRAELKAESLRTGKAIQGFYNVIEALTKPMESHLLKQEKFAEVIEEQKRNERLINRVELLSEVVEDASLYNLKDMSEQGFQELLKNSKLVKEVKAKKEKEAEEKIKQAGIEAEERQKKIEKENEKLKKELEEKQKKDAEKARLDKIELDKKNKENIRKNRLAKIESDKRRKELDEANAKLRKAEDDRKEIEAEKKRKEDEAKEEAKKLKDAEDKKARDLKLAPDKEKLAKLSNDLSLMSLPEVKSEEANDVLKQVRLLLSKVSIYIIKNSNNL